ncbi:phosphate/phosphite/phosphonate ABC transporter substrate-binding protein [Alkalibacterium sp. 20]|uniref:phosphate/phosphite/phosphonate ABC transporter substrate-binding protein n=1 Tax=Alkalibacterium sp. 20 TaxID=1798803 RepID=UPI0008FFEE4F|nr:PhnD/SsuA/transferrin family substrate-binding protein [Alkalibacterium sp. 20]OJF91808.1 phosphonate ABC transporter substrate-binding protein [Alkalibacterium sp. 20]
MSKKWFKGLGITLASVMLLSACGTDEETTEDTSPDNGAAEDEMIEIDELSVGFVPSRDPDEIVTATEPLEQLLIDELAEHGYDVNSVEITVGTNYEAVGEAMSAGTLDVGFIPGGTFVLYDDSAEVILTATRAGLNNDSEDPAEWNENKPTEGTDGQVTYYRSLLIAGPSEKGRELADKINSGEELTWEDVDSASWSVMNSSSSAGYIYPTIWLQDNFDQSLTDLSQIVQADSYANSFARLASEQVDLIVAYADARRDYVDLWEAEYGREADIWEETDVVGVTPGIYNDTISVSQFSDIMDDDLKEAIQQAFINIAQTDEGREVIAIYAHEGYEPATSEDYDVEREAQKILLDVSE